MRKMFKGRKPIAAAVLCCIALFTTCKNNINIGMGGSIDINPPAIDVKTIYPPIGAVIRDSFLLSVVAADDTGIASVNATVINTAPTEQPDGKERFFNLTKADDGVHWTATLNTKGDQGFPFKDGSYKVQFLATDSSGKTVRAESAFTIDNTPPLLILSRPSTAIAGYADSDADIFGDKFLLKGQLYDKSDVEKLTITARDADGNLKGNPAVLYNVPQSLNITVDSFFTPRQGQNFYRSIYGKKTADGKQQYSYTITVSDSAREYTDPSKTAGTGEGNSTSTYYLYNDLYQMLNESRYKPAEIYAMMQAGIYGTGRSVTQTPDGNPWTAAKIVEFLQKPEIKIGSGGSRNGTFALNPSINPKYGIEGFSPHQIDVNATAPIASGEYDEIYVGSKINIKLSTNFDEDPLNPAEQYEFYLIKADTDAELRSLMSIDVNKDDDLYSDPAAKTLKSNIQKLTIPASDIKNSGSNYVATTVLKDLAFTSYYILQVRGCDQNSAEHTMVADPKDKTGGQYVFKMIQNGEKPEVSIVQINGKAPQAGRFYIKDGDNAAFDVVLNNTSAGKVVCTLMPSFDAADPVDSDGNRYYQVEGAYPAAPVHIELPKTKFNQGQSAGYRITVQAKDTQGAGASLTQEYQLYYDADGPVISSNVSGTVTSMPTIEGDIYDAGVGVDYGTFTAVYTHNGGAKRPLSVNKLPTAADNKWKLNSPVGGEGKYKVTLTAQDTLGNTATKELEFVYDSAAPVINAVNNKPIADLKKNPTIIGGAIDGGTHKHYIEITGTITEANDIESVTVDGQAAAVTDSAPAYTFTYRLEKDNDWNSTSPVSIVVTDIAGKTDRIDLNVTIDTESPAFTQMKVGNGTTTKDSSHQDIFTNSTVANASYTATTVPVAGTLEDFGSGVKEVTAVWTDGSTPQSVTFPAVAASTAGTYTIEGALGLGSLTDVDVTFTAKDRAGKPSVPWEVQVSVVSSDVILSIGKDISASTPALEKEGAHYVHTAFKIKVKGKWEGSTPVSSLELSVTKDGAAAQLSSAAPPPAGYLKTEVTCDDSSVPAASVLGDKITGLISGKKVGSTSSQHEYIVTLTPQTTGVNAHTDDGRYVFTFKNLSNSRQVSETIYIDTKGPSIEPSRPNEGSAISLDDTVPGGKLSATMFDNAGVNNATARAYYRKKTSVAPAQSAYRNLTAAEAYIVLSGSPLSGAFKNAKKWNGAAYTSDPDTVTPAHTTVAATGTAASELSEGEYEVWFGAQDNLDQLNTTEPITVVYDMADPTAKLEVSTDNAVPYNYSVVGELYVKTGFKVKVSGSDTNGVTDIKLQLKKDDPAVTTWTDKGHTAINPAESLAEGTYDVAFAAGQEGAYTLRAIVTDKAGKQAVATCSVIYDTKEPSLTVPDISALRTASGTPPIGEIVGTGSNQVYWINKSTLSVGGSSADTPAAGANKASGIKQVEYSVDGGTNWNVITTNSGNWNATVNPGTQGVSFKVTDKAGNLKEVSRAVKSDMMPPALTVKTIKRQDDGGTGTADLSVVHPLRADAKLDITYTVADEAVGSGIKANSVTVEIKSGSTVKHSISNQSAGSGDNTATIDMAGLNSTALPDGDYTVALSVMDNAGNISVARTFNIKIDRKPPTITMLSPAPDTKHGTSPNAPVDWARNTRLFGKVRITGSFSDDGSGMNDPVTYTYIIGKDKTSPKPLLNGDTFKPISNGSWSLDIANAENYCKTTDYVLDNGRYDINDVLAADGIIYKIPLYLIMEDKAGNKAEQAFYIMVDSSGKTPVIDIQAPDQKLSSDSNPDKAYGGLEVITVGGTVQFSGLVQTANPAAGTIKKVYVSFSTKEDFSDSFTANFKAHGEATAASHNLAALTGDKGIKIADDTNLKKWSFTVDTSAFVAGQKTNPASPPTPPMIAAGADGSVTLFYKIQAENNEGTTVWTKPRKITFDQNYPYVTARKVKQLVSASPLTYTETEYINNSPVKDGDMLVCELLSVNDISEITLKSSTVGADYINNIGTKTGDTAITGTQIDSQPLFERIHGAVNTPRGYRMKLPIKLGGLKDPEQILSIEVSITDNKTDGKKTNFVQFNLKYDKTDPAVIFGAPVGKIGTGNFSAASANDITAAVADMDIDDLYVFVETKNGSAKEIKVTGVGNGFITYANVGEIFSNTGSMYVLVRKNTVVYDTAASDWQLQGFAYDTGTGVKEVTAKLGSLAPVTFNTFTPELGYFSSFKQSIKTTDQPDGETALKLSVIDKAGRTGTAPDTNTYLRNKPLMIGKVHFKTDLNGDNVYSNDDNTGREEEISAAGHKKYINSGADNRQDQQNYIQTDMDIHGEFSLKNKDKSRIVFELLGGQGSTYSYALYKTGANGEKTGNALKSGTLPSDKTIDFAAADFAPDKIPEGDNQKFVIVLKETTVTDEHRELRLTVTLNVKTKDFSKPQVTVLPFYWNGEGKDDSGKPRNSLPDGDRTKGHIEITRVSAGNGVSDVSGTVIVRGTAYHPSRLSAIELDVPGVSPKPKVSYTNGAWSLTAGSGLSVDDERLDAHGHWVVWKYEWKTDAPALDQTIKVTAIRTEGTDITSPDNNQGAELPSETAKQRGNTQSMMLELDENASSPVKGQFIRLFKDDQSYLVTVNEVKEGEKQSGKKKVTVNWQLINVPKDITSYYLYPVGYNTASQPVPDYNRPSVKLNVVPYITAIESTLSDSDETLTRSALGDYPVAQGSTIKLHGFNLTSSPEVKLGTQPVTVGAANSDGSYNVTIPNNAACGALAVKVGDIEAINNSNKSPEFAADGTATKAAYNVQATKANKLLTDDVKLLVWEVADIDTNASEDITSPMLKIASDSKWYMSYGKKGARDDMDMKVNINGTEKKIDQSYNKFHNTTVAYDSSGNIYTAATNTDRIDDWSAKFSFYSRIPEQTSSVFPTSAPLTAPEYVITIDKFVNDLPKYKYGFGARSYQLNWKGKARLEKVYNEINSQKKYDINRVPRPKMAVTGNTSNTEVYMSYFDANHPDNPVKFRYGTVDSNNGFNGGIKDGGTPRVHTVNSVSVTDAPYHANALQGSNGSATGYHTIANKNTTHKGGLYTAVGIVPKDKAGTAKDVAVVAWYDATAKNLVYSYNVNPDETNATAANAAWHSAARVIDNDSTSGWYVDLTVDEKGGIHIAYYNNKNSELRYIYLSKYDVPTVASAQVKKVTVDSYQSVGTQVTVSTRKETISGNERIVPYISYYQAAFYNSPNSVRVAWRTDFSGDVKNGAENDLFTGAWEAMTIPVQDGTVPQDATICNGVPTTGDWANAVVLGFMTNDGYKKAVLKK